MTAMGLCIKKYSKIIRCLFSPRPFPKILRRNGFHLCIRGSVRKGLGDAAFLFRVSLELERLDF